MAIDYSLSQDVAKMIDRELSKKDERHRHLTLTTRDKMLRLKQLISEHGRCLSPDVYREAINLIDEWLFS